MSEVHLLYALIPAFFGLVALALLAVAIIDRRAEAARWGALAFLMSAAGLVLDTLRPPGAVWMLIPLHLAILACFGQCLAARHRRTAPRAYLAALMLTGLSWGTALALGVGLNGRMLVFHAGTALALVPLVQASRRWAQGRPIDRLLVGSVTLLALTYWLRVGILVARPLSNQLMDRPSFFDIPTGVLFHVIMALGGAMVGLTLLVALGHDAVSRQARQARTDPLTRLGNRRAYDEAVEADRSGHWRCHGAVSIDLDLFKRVNDLHGHATGDALLIAAARALDAAVGSAGRLCRVGGEEFLLLADARLGADPALLAEAARHAIAQIRLPIGKGRRVPPLRSTCSVGWAVRSAQCSIARVVERADDALYRAKAAGRNCVVAA